MSAPADRDRRPPLPASTSGPDVFGRPMDPAPAPLVYINGWHGIGKETVAECLTLLLGRDKSLLIDVRSVGHDEAPASGGSSHASGTTKHPHQHHPRHRPDRSPLLTPEHPRYFSFDDGLRAALEAEPEAETEAEADPDSGPPSPSTTTTTTSPAQSPPTSRSASFSSTSTTSTTTTTITTASATTKPTTTPPTLTTTPVPLPAASSTTTTSPSITPSQSSTTPTPISAVPPSQPSSSTNPRLPTPCSATNLAALLSRPANTARIAVLAACCPDTPSGRAALRTYQAAAERAGRRFVGVMLEGGGQQGGYKGWKGMGSRVRGGSDGFMGSLSASVSGEGRVGRRGRLGSLPVPLGLGLSMATVMGGGEAEAAVGVDWQAGMGLAEPEGGVAGLTVDVGSVPAFEAALLIVGFVRGLEAEGRCGGGGCAAAAAAAAGGGAVDATAKSAAEGGATAAAAGSAASASTTVVTEGEQKLEVAGGE